MMLYCIFSFATSSSYIGVGVKSRTTFGYTISYGLLAVVHTISCALLTSHSGAHIESIENMTSACERSISNRFGLSLSKLWSRFPKLQSTTVCSLV